MQTLWQQNYDPAGNIWLSALIALIPIVFFFLALTKLRLKGYQAGTVTVLLALGVALLFYKMPARRRTLGYLFAGAAGAAVSGLPGMAQAQARPVLRIGYQKYGTLTLLKGRGTLDQRLAAKGIDVKWTEFPAGPV
eukprot:gene37188-45877_t